MYRFQHPDFLYLLGVIPLILLLFFVSVWIQKKRLQQFGNMQLISQLMPNYSNFRQNIKFWTALLALGLLIVAVAQPQKGSKLEKVKREGVEIIIALDVSNSMMAEDIAPNRLQNAVMGIKKFVERLENDKLGLIVFAGDAYMQVPVTVDYSSVKMFLSTINTKIVPKQGTAIGSAIELSMKAFTPDNEKSKALIIITDGENHEDDAVELAKEAVKNGISTYTVGIGDPNGKPIPIRNQYGQKEFRKNKDGEIVITRLNETMLRQIASAGNGAYVHSNNTRRSLDKLFAEINKLDKIEIEAQNYSAYSEMFPYFVGFALFFLLLDFIIQEKRNKFFKRFYAMFR